MSDWTLAALKARNMEINAFCQNESCRQFFVFNTDAMIEGFGAETRVDELPKFECSGCGGPTVFKLSFVQPGEE